MSGSIGDDQVREVREHIEMWQRSGLSVAEAAKKVAPLVSDQSLIQGAVEQIREVARRLQILKVPAGVTDLAYRHLIDDVRRAPWYTGPRETDRNWPALRGAMLRQGFGDSAVESIDHASSKVVAHLADPGIRGLDKKGLVVGFVQSGKTANYSAVLAKAADTGYRLFIVLAGVHNSLRSQTQARLERDLIGDRKKLWYRLTDVDNDFGTVTDGAGLLFSRELRNLIVIKKNAQRLERLRAWLSDIPEGVRAGCPAIIIDDEADQATPNTKAGNDERTRINDLTRQIFELLPSGAYVGYTATPFANVFIDPGTPDDLFPRDFILDLPRPEGYFGAEQLFGRESIDADDPPSDEHDMVRRIPDSEAVVLRPPTKRVEREEFRPDIPDSLRTALLWFVLCRCARRARGQRSEHASMLVHTSQYVAPHFALASTIRTEIEGLRNDSDGELRSELNRLWNAEKDRVPAAEFGNPAHEFAELITELEPTLSEMRVIVDNGLSPDRLDYTGPDAQVVIAVGGSTLSRGLTLEGLSVSYFLRTSRTYDTLLQMGRWFGFRRGYEDLPRIWLTDEMADQFRFLATVEAEVRADIRRFEREAVTPMQLAVRVRQHPAMAITAPGKMRFAQRLKISYGGRRKQTFRFDILDQARLEANLGAGRRLVRAARAAGSRQEAVDDGRWVLRDVSKSLIIDFLNSYGVNEKHKDLLPELTTGYLENREDDRAALWNVAIIGSSVQRHELSDGSIYEPGAMEIGLDSTVLKVVRSRLDGPEDVADIKSLMSTRDRAVDLGMAAADLSGKGDDELQGLRRTTIDGRGLLLLYPIAGDSMPLRATSNLRKRLGAAADVLGMGIVFPEPAMSSSDDVIEEHDYVGLPAHLLEIHEELDEEELARQRVDLQGDAVVDGSKRLGELDG